MNAQKLLATIHMRTGFLVLFERQEDCLEPLNCRGIVVDLDTFNAAEAAKPTGRLVHVPDILKNGCLGRSTNASSNKYRDLIIKHIFS
jgi:hypothetical protein